MATILVGTDVRHWLTYTVTDLTPEEKEILEGDDKPARKLAAAMLDAGRLTEESEEIDDNPTIFAKYDHPSIINVED